MTKDFLPLFSILLLGELDIWLLFKMFQLFKQTPDQDYPDPEVNIDIRI